MIFCRVSLRRGLGTLACIWFCFAVAAPAQSAQEKSTLRVGLWTLWHDRQMVAAPAAPANALLRNCEFCAAKVLMHSTKIQTGPSGLTVDGVAEKELWLSGAVTLSAHGETLTLHNPIHITAGKDELILAVTLPVESYVERVVASESGAADSLESMKALAVVVRSFALHQAHGHARYDLCDSTHCQLLRWSGKAPSARAAEAHAATLATAGETLWFHGAPAQAWFHQNCGGRTASPDEVWPSHAGPKMPWLVSRTDSYCTAAGAREWSATLSRNDLTAALAAAGLVRPGWRSLAVARRGESGRAVQLQVDGTVISAEDFRLAVGRALGWNRILSNWFEVAPQGDSFVFHGRGSGHGVGLCQAGAAAMAAQGRTMSQILAQYFPGAVPADEATGKSWQSLRSEGFVLETLDPVNATTLSDLHRALAEAESRSGLQPQGSITLRAFASTPAFRDATLASGWVAAFTEGNWIAAQPLATLDARRLLVPTLRHEFLHVLVESRAGEQAPLWLREGLVEFWADDSARTRSAAPAVQLDAVNQTLARAGTESQSEAAHRAAGCYAGRLLSRFGRAQVLEWLRVGVPQSALSAIR